MPLLKGVDYRRLVWNDVATGPKKSSTISSVIWIQYTNVTDRRTATGRQQRPRLRIVSRGNKQLESGYRLTPLALATLTHVSAGDEQQAMRSYSRTISCFIDRLSRFPSPCLVAVLNLDALCHLWSISIPTVNHVRTAISIQENFIKIQNGDPGSGLLLKGSVATHLRCDGIFKLLHTGNHCWSLRWKNFDKKLSWCWQTRATRLEVGQGNQT